MGAIKKKNRKKEVRKGKGVARARDGAFAPHPEATHKSSLSLQPSRKWEK